MPINNEVIFQNAIQCPDGVILCSRSRHDFREHKGYFLDGGISYCRVGYPNNPPPKSLMITDKDTYLDMYEKVVVDIGKKKEKLILLKDCDREKCMIAYNNLLKKFPDGGGYTVSLQFSLINYHVVEKLQVNRDI